MLWMHLSLAVIVWVGINSFFSFWITFIPHLFGTTCTRLTQVLYEIGYIIHALSSLTTSFLTTYFIMGFRCLWSWAICLNFSSIIILCIQYDGIIPSKSDNSQPITYLLLLRIRTNIISCSGERKLLIITDLLPFSCKTYFKCDGNVFNSGLRFSNQDVSPIS